MRLFFQYQPATGGVLTVALADEEYPVPPRTQRDAVSGYRAGGRCLVQENPTPEAKDMDVFTRKNRALVIQLRVERCHATRDAAAKFARDELELIGKRGTLIDYQSPQVRYPDGVMESVECLLLCGLTTIHHYTFRGGRSTGPTTAYPAQ